VGESIDLFRAEFNPSIRVDDGGDAGLTSNAGAIVVREALQRLGMVDWLQKRLTDRRKPALITHPQIELVMTMVNLYALGWKDQDDADALRDDPAFRMSVSERQGSEPLQQRETDERLRNHNPAEPDGLPSQPTLSRMMHALSVDSNPTVLRDSLLETASRRFLASRGGHRQRYLTIDVDSLPVEIHGQQAGGNYNGYYHAKVFHPLIATAAETGDLLDIRLRPGNVHTANGATDFIEGLVEQVEAKMCQVAEVRIDAGFPEEGLLSRLETRNTPYIARIRGNAVLDRMASAFLKRPAGRPPEEPRTWTHEMSYQAKSWTKSRRVVLVVLERPGELLLHHFWLITNWSAEQRTGEDLLAVYRQRGTAEGHFGEFMSTLGPALSSAARPNSSYLGQPLDPGLGPKRNDFAVNEVILLLNALAYNVLHILRTHIAEATGEGCSIQRVRERVLRVAARIVKHSRYVTFVIESSAKRYWRILATMMRKLKPPVAG
jgi:hypothetical protein